MASLSIALTLLAAVSADTVRVADPAIGPLSLSAGFDTVDNYLVAGGQRRHIGLTIQSVSETAAGYLVIQRNETATGQLQSLDTIAVARGTLATLWHGDVTPAGSRHVSFEGGRMRGVSVDSTGRSETVDEPVPPGLFDYSIFGMVANQLPLAEGYRAVVATFDITRGPQFLPVSVAARETIERAGERHDAWRLETELAPGWVVSRWVATDDRSELRWWVKSGTREMTGEAR